MIREWLSQLTGPQYFLLLWVPPNVVMWALIILGFRSLWVLVGDVIAVIVLDRILGRIEFGRW